MSARDYASKKNKRSVSNNRAANTKTRFGHNTSSRSKSILSNLANPMFIIISLVGLLFIGSIIYLEYLKSNDKNIIKTTGKVESKKAKVLASLASKQGQNNQNNKDKQSNKPVFEFYHTLPKGNGSINIGRDVASNSNNVDNINNTNQVISKNNNKLNKIENKSEQNKKTYVVQLASFRDLKDAEAMRAKLILSGYDVQIQSVKLPSGDVWHRVKTSKINDIKIAQNISKELKKQSIDSMVMVNVG